MFLIKINNKIKKLFNNLMKKRKLNINKNKNMNKKERMKMR